MKNRKTINFFLALLCLFLTAPGTAEFDQEQARRQVIKFLRSTGLGDELDAGVTVSAGDSHIVSIADNGKYLLLYGHAARHKRRA